MSYVQALIGLTILVFAGDFLVRGAVALAKRMGVSTLVIGLTIIAFGTSAPELVVAIKAIFSGAGGLAMGNVVGSNIANVLLVIGLPALLAPICCSVPRVTRNLIFMLIISCMFVYIANGFTLFGYEIGGHFTWVEGIPLVALLLWFLIYSALRSKAHPEEKDPTEIEFKELEELEEAPLRLRASLAMVIAGLIGLAVGADLLVDSAIIIARGLGVSEEVIGLTLVAIGTSLPELVTALVAAVRKHYDVAIGNVIGSNIFNILGIVGIASFFGEIPVSETLLRIDLWVMLGTSALLLPFCAFQGSIGRYVGALMLIGYGSYMYHLMHVGSVVGA